MSEHMDLWNKLGTTDPAQTKSFNRAGGFKGTAIKPIYTEQKMTEQFGPCGVGWGIDEPKFQTVPGNDGQVAVYCWVSIWIKDGDTVSAPIHGVGGDMVVVKQSSGLRTDDEAFKKAFTDAVGNAMKHLGMSADVHMGRFDDNKYVNERRAEVAEEREAEPEVIQSNPTAKQHFKTVYDDITACKTLKQLQGAWERHQPVIKVLPADHRTQLEERKNEMKDWLSENAASGGKPVTTYNFDSLDAAPQ